MARQKNDKPRHVSIYYDQILYDLDVMDNECAGIILKMIVWYSMGTPESKEKIAEMQQYIDTLPPMGKAWLTSLYKRLFACIDEDFEAYAEMCEKRKQAIEKRWKERAQEDTSVNNSIQENTSVNNSIQENASVNNSIQENTNVDNSIQEDTSVYLNDNDTDTDTELSNDNNNIKQQQEQQDASARKKKNLPKAKIKDFRKLWNNICNDFKERQQPCRLKFIKPGDLPGDAEERLNKVLCEIYGGLTQEVANDVLDLYGCKTEEGRTMENAAKYYLVRAIENMAAVKMKMEDTSFGSFQWLMKSPERIRKMYDRDIQ